MNTGRIGSTAAALAAPALILLAIVVAFLGFHEYSLLLPESLALMGCAVAIGGAVGVLSRLRPQSLGPVLIALLLCLFLYVRPQFTDSALRIAAGIDARLGNPALSLSLVALPFFAAACALCWVLRIHLNSIVIAVFGTIALTTIILPIETGGTATEAGAIPAVRADLPPVVHIIVDEHIGVAGLPQEAPRSAAAHDAIVETYRDFALYTHAYSRFAETKFALTSLMNGNVGHGIGDYFQGEVSHFRLKSNAWFESLKAQGYALRVYQSTWFDMCADRKLVDSCYTYPMFSPNAVQRTNLTARQRFHVLLDKLVMGPAAPQLGPMPSMEALAQFETDIAAAPRGVAFILHVLLPHGDYLFNADCSLADPALWAQKKRDPQGRFSPAARAAIYDRYLAQLVCTEKRVGALFAEMKRLGVYDDATIVVHGDHGSRIGEDDYILHHEQSLPEQTLLDDFQTLLAIKSPGLTPGPREKPAALQAIFADTFLGGSRDTGDAAEEAFIRVKDSSEFQSNRMIWSTKPAPEPEPDSPAEVVSGLRASLN